VLAFSADGCRAEPEFGNLLSDRLDAAGFRWLDVVVGSQPNIDTIEQAVAATSGSSREPRVTNDEAVAVVIVGSIADYVIAAISLDPRIAGIAVVNAGLSDDSVDLLSGWKQVPIVGVVDAADGAALATAVDLYCAGTHPDRDLEIVSELDVGGESFGSRSSAWQAALDTVVFRLRQGLASGASRRDVMFSTSDGWEIHGTLAVPDRAHPVPAAVLLHSGRSDRAVFAQLERLMTRRGVAVLSIDWRGRGVSQNIATYFELSNDERAHGSRDATAALDALALDPRIDVDRVAMVGVVHGAEHAVAASIGDPRVQMLGVLTGFMPRNESERAHLVSGDVEVLYITCEGHGPVTAVMEDLVAEAPPGRATLRQYPGGAIGYQLFDIDPALEDFLAEWVATGLDADRGVVASAQ
jgi:dienelactone hydrolase